MRFLHAKSISIFLLSGYLLISGSGSAGLIEKDPYSIPLKIKYKEKLNILIPPFEGELSEERKYAKELIRNYLGDKILLYKKIRFPYTFIDFKANPFNSSDREQKKFNNPESGKKINGTEDIKERFLEVNLIENDRISDDRKNAGLDRRELIDSARADILITGELKQDINNLKIKIKISNNIYGNVILIEKDGPFKNIYQLLDALSYEVIKAIIVKYSYIAVTSNEKGAAIYIDDRYFGRTDKSDILLESGSHKITLIKEDNSERLTTVILKERSTKLLHIEFITEEKNLRNSIKIVTEPDKAKVYIDSSFIGISPIVKNGLRDGTYRVRVEKEGYITKYQTIVIDTGKETNTKNDLSLTLEKGDSREYYFSRTSAYNNLFIGSSFGVVISSVSYLYFGLRANDQDAKLNKLSSSDPDYAAKKDKIEDRKDKYKVYQQISLYTAIGMIISAGIFYYLDKAQDDIDIAFYFPQINSCNYAEENFTGSASLPFLMERGAGIVFTKSF